MSDHALLTVMYHYVRPIRTSSYPGIKGLEIAAFCEQIRYLVRHHTVVRMEDVLAAARGTAALPRGAVLLTFDDGYRDHYEHAMPVLLEHGVQGSFFVPADPVLHRRLLDVNRVHFVLARTNDPDALSRELDTMIVAARDAYDLPSTAELRAMYHHASRLDVASVIYIKRLLQHALPSALRTSIARELFERVVGEDEAAFAESLYLSRRQIEEMRAAGMHIGGHGARHDWLAHLPTEAQETEVNATRSFLGSFGVDTSAFTFAYPYGSYNSDTLAVLRRAGCAAAFTTRADVARAVATSPLELPRLDTNDLPRQADAPPSAWTEQAYT